MRRGTCLTALICGCDFCTLAASVIRDYRSLVESGCREWWKPSQGQIWPFARSASAPPPP